MQPVLTASGGRPYRGADRRHRLQGPPVVALPMLPSVVVLVLLGLLTAAVTRDDPVRAFAVDEGLRLLASASLTGAGVLALVRWRMTGLTRPAFVGAGLLTLGVFAASLRNLAPFVHGELEQVLPGQLTAASTTLASLWLFVWARRAPAIDAGAQPQRVLAGVSMSVPLLCAAVAVWVSPLTMGADALPVAVPWLLLACMWSGVTVAEARAGIDGRAPWLVRVFGCLAAAAALDGVAAFVPQPAGSWAAVLTLAAGVVAVHGAFSDVLHSLSAQSTQLQRLSLDVQDREDRQRWVRAQEEERLHEVRSVLAGLHGATATLRKYEDHLDPGVRRRLEDAVTAELRRLAHLVDPQLVAAMTDVDVEEALNPVVVAQLQDGADLSVDLGGIRARARAADLATVVCALLVNARRHAPGSPVLLRAEHGEDEVRIYVEDRGPGVTLDQREAVFARGERAEATAPGSGLGLYTARRLATEMGGTLRVDSRPGGGASFVLVLAAAWSVADSRQHGAERDAQVGEVVDLQVVRRLERRAVPRQREDGGGRHLPLPSRRHHGHVHGTVDGDGGGDALEVEDASDGVAQQ